MKSRNIQNTIHRISKRIHLRTWIALGIILLLVPIALLALNRPAGSDAAWFDDSFAYRKQISFTHNAALTDRRVTVTIDTATLIAADKMRADCRDTRFTDGNGLRLRFELTGTCDNASTTYDVVFPTIINGSNVGYVYYGNPSAPDASEDVSAVTSLSPSGGSASLGSEEKVAGPTAYWKMDEFANNTCPLAGGGGNTSPLSAVTKSSVTMATNESSKTVNVSVNASKTILLFSVSHDEDQPECGLIAGNLNSGGTQITFRRGSSFCNNSATIQYSLVEFSSGVTVQRGVLADGNGDAPKVATLNSAVDVTKSFPIISMYTDFSAYNSDDFAEADITDENTLTVRLNNAHSQTQVEWQVVEFDDAVIHTDQVQIGSGSTSQSADTASNFDIAKSWLMFTYRTTVDPADPASEAVRGAITDNNTLTFDRNASGTTIDITYYVVEFTNDTLVDYGTLSFANTTATDTDTISITDASKAVITAGGLYYSGGKGSFNSDDNFGHTQAALTITNTTTVSGTRGGTSGTADMDYFVVQFDDSIASAPENDICDTMSGSNHLEKTSTTYINQDLCLDGGCHLFNGTSAGLDRADSDNFDYVAADSFTFSGWFRAPPISSGTKTLMSKFESTGADGGYAIYLNSDGNVVCGIDDDNTWGPDASAATSSANYDDNHWHHFSCVKDGTSTLKLYMDGVLAQNNTSISGVGTLVNDDSFYIGRDAAGNYFRGYMDEVKMYRYARSEAQVYTDFLSRGGANGVSAAVSTDGQRFLSDGLVGYWKMDGSSGNASDNSGNGNSLTNNGTTTYVAGKFGNGSEHVPASTQYLSTSSTISGIYTVSFWVNPDSNTNNYMQLTSSDYVTSSSGTISAAGFGSETIYVNGVESSTITANTWQHVVIVSTSAINANAFEVGRANGSYFDGTMDDVRVYGRALTPVEVRQLSKWAPSPVAYWDFNGVDGGNTVIDKSGNNNVGTIGELIAGNSVKVYDTFTESSDTLLTSHTPDVGTGWTEVYNSSSNNATVIASTDVLQHATQTNVGATYTAQPAPTSADQDISFTIKGKPTDTGTRPLILFGQRADASNMYAVEIKSNEHTEDSLILWKVAGGSFTNLGSYDETLTTSMVIKLELRNGAQKVYADAVERISATDTTHTSAGTWGVGFGRSDGYSTGFGGHIHNSWLVDDFTAEEAASAPPAGGSGTAPGKFGKSYQLDGYDDYISITDNGYLDFGVGQSFTISTYFKRPATTATSVLMAKHEAVGADGGYKLYMNSSGNIICGIDSDGTSFPADSVTSAADYDDDQWHHVACVRDGNSSLRLYVDGMETGTPDTSIASTATLVNNDVFYIGIDGDGSSNLWSGYVDDMKVYNYARSPEQVIQDMNGGHPIGGSPVASQQNYWKFDEGYGTTANDSGYAGYNGTLSGSPTWKMKDACKVNGCLEFNGSSQYLSATGNQTATQHTITMWIKPDAVTNRGIAEMAESPGSSTHERSLYFDGNSKLVAYNYDGSTDVARSTTTFQTGTWYHIALVKDATTVSVWVNGRKEASTASGNPYASYTTPEYIIGRTYTGFASPDTSISAYYDGLIDEVKYYTIALTEEQMLVDMNANSAIALGTTTTSEATQNVPGGAGDPPVAYWKMDENTGTTANDSSGNGNTGTMTGGTWAPGKVGSAIFFDGNDYINAGSGSSMDLQTFTITTWVKSATSSGQRTIIGQTTDGGYQLRLENSTNKIQLNKQGNVNIFTSPDGSVITNDVWTHIAVSYNAAGNYAAYVNGSLVTSGTNDQTLTYSTVTIGRGYGSGEFFNGHIDDLKIYNYVLSPAQVAYDYNRGAPVGHWKFDECSGATAYDASGNGKNGTITAGGTPGNTAVGTCTSGSSTEMRSNGATGKLNASLDFDGDADRVEVADSGSSDPLRLGGSQNLSLSAWVKIGSLSSSTTHYIISKHHYSNQQGYALAVQDTGAVSFITNGNLGLHSTSTGLIQAGQWYHLAAVFEGGTSKKIYINGKLVKEDTISSTSITAYTSTLSMGTPADTLTSNLYATDGLIDDSRVYNYALSGSQILKIMNDNAGVRFGPSEGQP